jgi:hypothetical protein
MYTAVDVQIELSKDLDPRYARRILEGDKDRLAA